MGLVVVTTIADGWFVTERLLLFRAPNPDPLNMSIVCFIVWANSGL